MAKRVTKRSLQDEVRELRLRSNETDERLDKKRIELVLRNHKSVIPKLWKFLAELGFNDDNIEVPEAQGAMSRQAKAMIRRGESKKVLKQEALDDAAARADIIEPIDCKYKTVADLTIETLKNKLLCNIEPVALSIGNLRQFEKTIGRAGCLKIFVYVTALELDSEVFPTHVCWKAYLEFCVDRYNVRGRRASLLVMPPSWSEAGVYTVVASTADGVEVLERATKVQKFVPADEIEGYTPGAVVTVGKNHSEINAFLAVAGVVASEPLMLGTVFTDHFAAASVVLNDAVVAPRAVPKTSRVFKYKTPEKKEVSSEGSEKACSTEKEEGDSCMNPPDAKQEELTVVPKRLVFDESAVLMPKKRVRV
eukprot:3909652-Amphidinium_carterae.2